MKKIFLFNIVLFVAGLSYAQTSTENYIQTTNCLDADCVKKIETVQYFDYLGRPKQIINIKSSPTGKDIVAHVEYDELGRQTKSYLPIPQPGTQNGEIYPSPLSNAPAHYGGEKIYSESFLENSPLQRIQQQVQVGNDWASKPVNFTYDVNSTADAVKKFTPTTVWENEATTTTFTDSELYANGQLTKNAVKDEDGNETIEFKNGWGQTVLARKMLNTTQKADTYYIYNEYGSLAYVIPPLASVSSITSTILDNLCYQYKYDSRNNLVEKKLPGKGWEYMVYDKQDRLVASQDANLRAKGQWQYVKYDQFGRVAITGISTGSERITEQNMVTVLGSNNVNRLDTAPFNRQGVDVYYGNQDSTYPNSTKWVTLLSLNYYDTYPNYSFNPAFPSSIIDQPVLTDNPATDGKSTKGLPVISLVKNVEDDNWMKNFNYYDKKGRIIGTYAINHLGGYTKTESELDFAGATKQSKVYHKRLNTDTEKVITQTYTYDNQNRLLVHRHKVDNNTEEILTQNEYNELSQLKNKKVGGTNTATPLQSIDYVYNIRGWLTKINDPANLNGKLFGYEMRYNNPVNPSYAFAKFNGNITEVDWKTSNDGVLRRYDYQYDALNRLKKGIYFEPNSSVPGNDFFNESLDYDLNGNISTLQRNQKSINGALAEQIDDLSYNYSGNRLTSVTDGSHNYNGYPDISGNTIAYDDNGNMTNQKDKGILGINYNYLNLPNHLIFDQYYIVRNNGLSTSYNINTKYIYNASGEKLKKIYTYSSGRAQNMAIKSTDYLDGFQYEQTGTSSSILKFIPTAEGYFNFENNKYIYNYKDHLGNTRISFANSDSGVEMIDENNYYPFGLKHEGYNNLTNINGNLSYKYKYNGQELQETGFYAMDWRDYMPDLGRFTGMDAMAESYADQSSYHFAMNNPVSFSDPTGMYSMDASGNMNTTNQGEINELFGYFKGGGRISGLTKFISTSSTFKIDIPEIILTFKGNSKTWNNSENIGENSFLMSSKITGALGQWNFDMNNGMLSDAIENTKVGQSVSAAENFLFLELPGTMLGGELLSAGWRAAGLSRYLCGPLGRVSNGLLKICFTEGTLVSVENGNKKIEDIKEGDLVWSYNEETGKKELKKVVELSRNTSSSLVKISLNGTEITCTPEHPFYVNGNWIEAKDLTKGTLLTTLDGTTSPVESINFLHEKVKVYNFEVEGNHNYYVSEKGILVHNNCTEELISRMISQDSKIVKLARETFKSNKAIAKEAENLIMNLERGNMNPGIGTKNVARDIFEARSRNGARVYFRNSGDSLDILGYSDKSNQQKVINWLLDNF